MSIIGKIEAKYVYFLHDSKDDKPKTHVWKVFAKGSDDWLGQISWFGQWRRYSFRSTYKIVEENKELGTFLSDVWFEWQCLRDIADFCEKLTKHHRAKVEGVIGSGEL